MKDSKKVLHVLWGLHAAGIENLALQLIKHSPKNIECDLLNLEPSTLDMLPEFNALINKGDKYREMLDRFENTVNRLLAKNRTIFSSFYSKQKAFIFECKELKDKFCFPESIWEVSMVRLRCLV